MQSNTFTVEVVNGNLQIKEMDAFIKEVSCFGNTPAVALIDGEVKFYDATTDDMNYEYNKDYFTYIGCGYLVIRIHGDVFEKIHKFYVRKGILLND